MAERSSGGLSFLFSLCIQITPDGLPCKAYSGRKDRAETPDAVEDLETIAEYIARDSSSYASSVVSKIVTVAKTIPDFPRSGRIVPEIGDHAIREHVVFSYRLIYRVEPDHITLLAVIHGKRLLEKNPAWCDE